jgi:hypothetical protein
MILTTLIVKLIPIYKKYKESFNSRNKLFKHIFSNTYSPLNFTKEILNVNQAIEKAILSNHEIITINPV